MKDLITRPPRTIMEVYQMLPEGTLAELIEGNIFMSPSPLYKHQKIVSYLLAKILFHVEKFDLGEVFVAPFDVYLDEHMNAVQPDIVFVAKENLGIIKDHIHGVPDLVIEVLSAGNQTHDTHRKKELYEKFGVNEYWIVDPVTKDVIGYELSKGAYSNYFTGVGKISSKLLDHIFEF